MKVIFKLFLILLLIGLLLVSLQFARINLAPKPKTQKTQTSQGLHYGANQAVEFFDAAYENVQTTKPTDKIFGITVNHHLIAPNLVAEEMSLVATDKPITVILLSPNHFFKGEGGAISSLYDWRTPFGDLKNNQELTRKLAATGLVNIDESPFKEEHGINNIVGFIKKSLPNATFVPLIIKDNFPNQNVDALAAKLKDILPTDTLIVASFDFSHYLTSTGADFHDQQTFSILNNFDYDRIDRDDIDSHRAMRLLLKYFDSIGAKKFVLTNNSNSSKVTNNFTFLETTSYINGYFTAGSYEPDKIQTILYSPVADKQNRLFLYNDVLTSDKSAVPKVDFINLDQLKDMAVGYVTDNGQVTDVYLLPLDPVEHDLVLQTPTKADKILAQVAASSDAKLRNQIVTGHIIIK